MGKMLGLLFIKAIGLSIGLGRLNYSLADIDSNSWQVFVTAKQYVPDFILQLRPLDIVQIQGSGFDLLNYTLNYMLTYTPVFFILLIMLSFAILHLIINPIKRLIAAIKRGLRSLFRYVVRYTVLILLTIFVQPFIYLFQKSKSIIIRKLTNKNKVKKVRKNYIKIGFNKLNVRINQFKSASKNFFSFLLLRFFIYSSKDRYNQACA